MAPVHPPPRSPNAAEALTSRPPSVRRPVASSCSSTTSSYWSSTRKGWPPAMASSSSPASAAVVAEGSAACRFWIAVSTWEAAFAAYTPFLLSLAAGNLCLDAFSHYIAQDAHFLLAPNSCLLSVRAEPERGLILLSSFSHTSASACDSYKCSCVHWLTYVDEMPWLNCSSILLEDAWEKWRGQVTKLECSA